MKATTVKRASTRRRVLMLVLSAAMALQLIAPIAAPQTASATGEQNGHGTTLQTRVGTVSLNAHQSIAAPPAAYVDADKLPTYDNGIDFACQPGQITKQNKLDTVYLQTLITWGAGEPTNPATAPTLTFDKPAGATFALNGDSSTQGYIGSVSGDQGTTTAQITASTQITLNFKTGLSYSGLFNVDYSYTYNITTTPDQLMTDVTPTLNIPGSPVAIGDSLKITVACETDPYPGMTVNASPAKLNGSNNNNNYTNFDNSIGAYTSPSLSQLARVGSAFAYSLYPCVQTKLPNYPYATSTAVGNGNIPRSATFTLTLPAEARLVNGTPPTGWTASTAGGRTVLTTSTWNPLNYYSSTYYVAQPANTGGALQVYYTDRPAAEEAGGTAYVYSAKVEGTWYDGTTFSAEKTTITHLYDDTIPSLNFRLTVLQQAASYQGGGICNNGFGNFSSTNSYLALGDHEDFSYNISNNLTRTPTQQPSEVPLTDFTVTVPFEGDLWDIDFFYYVTSNRFDKMTVTYSDSSTEDFYVDDATKFGPVPGGMTTFTGPNAMSWLMEGKAAGVYITQLSFHAAPGFTIPVGLNNATLLGVEVALHSQRPDGTEIKTTPAGQTTVADGADVGKTSVSMTANAPAGLTSDPMSLTVTQSSSSIPIYKTPEDRPAAWGGTASSLTVGAASAGPGMSFPIKATFQFYGPDVAYNRLVPNPMLTLKLPESLSFDYSNAQLFLGYGPTSGVGNGNPATTRLIPPADYTVNVTSPGDGFTYYAFSYIGDTGSGSGNTGVLSLGGDHSFILAGAVTIADDAASETAVPIQVNTTSPAIATASPMNNSINIVTPTIMSAALASQGDLVPGVWMKDTDGSTATPFDDANLAKVSTSGTLRYQVINNAADSYSGDVYVKAPVGTLAPNLELQSVSADLVNGANSNPASVTWYYSLAAPVTNDDLTTIPAASWTAFTFANLTDPTTLPSGVTAFKLAGASTDPGDRLNITLNYNVSSSAVSGQTARSVAQAAMGAFGYTTLYAGFKVVHSSYQVNYYKDSVDSSNLIGHSDAVDADYGTEITLDRGTANGQLNAKQPTGYNEGVQQDPVPYVMQDGDETVNIINVLYTKKTDLSYTVNYYIDSTAGGTSGANYLGSATVNNQTFGDPVTLAGGTDPGQLNYKLADAGAGYGDGQQQGSVPYLITDGDNTIDVVYLLAANIDVTIYYYKDTVTGATSGPEYLGTDTITGKSLGNFITLEGNQLTKYQPDGYQTGMQTGTTPYIVLASGNIINVLYLPRTDLSYSIVYWKDAVGTGGTQVGTAGPVTDQTYGDTITLDTTEKNAFLPTGYNDGVQQAPVPYTIDVGTNTINVLYTKKTNLSYTVNYYIDSTAGGTTGANFLGASAPVTGQTFGANIVLASGAGNAQLDAYLSSAPAGYASPGIQTPSSYTIVDGTNTIDVIYHKATDIVVTVNYYQDSVTTPADTDTYLGSDTLNGHSITDEITLTATQLNAFQPTGYQAGTQQGTSPYVVVASGNVINVLYLPRTDLSYTVAYWKDAVGAGGTSLGSSAAVTNQTYGAGITLGTGIDNGQLNFMLPVGYNAGVQQLPVPYVIDLGTNTINVLYTKKTNLSYTVNYYIDSTDGGTTGANFLGASDPVTGQTFGANIVLSAGAGNAQLNAYLSSAPAGYASPGIQTPSSYTIVDGANIIDVIYHKATDIVVTVNYYKDSVTTPADTDTYLGSDTLNGHSITDEIALSATQLNAFQPTGYQAGTQQGTSPYVVVAADNVINVLYLPRDDLSYSIIYWKDAVGAGGTQIETAGPVTGQTFGASITLGAGTADGQLNFKRPVGYGNGAQQAPVPYTIGVGTNTINVLYLAKTYSVAYNLGYSGAPTPPPTMTDVLWTDYNLLPARPTRDGYTLDGWNVTTGGSKAGVLSTDKYADLATDEDTSSITLTAQWNANLNTGYTVQHYYVDASGTAAATPFATDTPVGKTDTLATAEPLTGVTGYTYDSTFPATVLSGNIAGDGSLVLKLYYRINKYSVSYSYTGTVPGGAPAAPGAEANVAYGAAKTVSTDPAASTWPAGYSFSGWSTTDASVTGGAYSMPDHAVAFSGSWIPGTATPYSVEHYYVDAFGMAQALPFATDELHGTTDTEAVAIPKTGLIGYTYDASFPDTIASGNIKGDGSLVLKLYYRINVHDITYSYTNTPAGAPDPSVNDQTSVAYNSALMVADDPTLTGWTFSGWNSREVSALARSFTMPDTDVVFTGSWTRNNYPVTITYYLSDNPGTPLHSTTTDMPYESVIDVSSILNAYKPAHGYSDGNSAEAPSYTVTDSANTIDIIYTPIKFDITILYHTFSAEGTVIAQEDVDPFYGQVIDPAPYLDLHRPAGFAAGSAAGAPWTVTDSAGGNVFDVYYPDTAPTINVARPVIYVRQPVKLTIADILRIAGVSITDPEESIPLSKLQVAGYSGVTWSTVNYPGGVGYLIRLDVKDTPGLAAPYKEIAVFVLDKSESIRKPKAGETPPSDYTPKGTKWGLDEDGDWVIYIPLKTPVVPLKMKTPAGSSGLPATGDYIALVAPLPLAAIAAAVLLIVFRRWRQTD
ncbi:MAG: InlB B-repeat-containing protein [Coriobacteriia bacterium]|nr:InlB B-repeat-containing protein [Coriobacteriia bacterium]